MTDKIEIGGLYRFHAPKEPGVFTGSFKGTNWTIWEKFETAFNATAKRKLVKIDDGTIILVVDYKSRPLFNRTPSVNVIWLHKVVIDDVCGWTLIDKDPELWDNYMTTFDDRLERL